MNHLENLDILDAGTLKSRSELQSWWEVPAIAHFCSVFQAAFNIFYFDVEELEASLLRQNIDEFISVEHLIMRLLPRCCGVKDVTNSNWEDHLRKLLAAEWPKEGRKNPLANSSSRFHNLPLRSKVDILYSLCHYRLDAEDVFDSIKNIDGDDLRADCIGFDSEKNIYWYFGGVRLYKENRSKQDTKENDKASRASKATKKTSLISQNWSVACFTKEDWEDLLKQLKKKRTITNKKLCENIEENYLPMLSAIIAKKERELKKRLLELAPRRCSSRIDEVKRKREVEEQRAAEIAEQERLRKTAEDEKRRTIEEKQKKRREIEDRAKRAEERRKALAGSELDENDDDSASSNSSLDDTESGNEIVVEQIHSDEDKICLRRITCSSSDKKNRNPRNPVFWNISQYCDSVKDFNNRNLCSNVQVMSNQQSSSPQNNPFFIRKKITLMRSRRDFVKGTASPSPSWRCLKTVSVPCEKLAGYNGEADLPDYEKKIGQNNFYTKSDRASNSVTDFGLLNRTQKTISRVH